MLVLFWRGEVEDVVPEAADGSGDVGRYYGQVIDVDVADLGGEFVNSSRDTAGGGIDDLSVLVGVVLADHFVSGGKPVAELVERLDAVGDRGDLGTQFRVGQIPQERDGAHDSAEIEEWPVEAGGSCRSGCPTCVEG